MSKETLSLSSMSYVIVATCDWKGQYLLDTSNVGKKNYCMMWSMPKMRKIVSPKPLILKTRVVFGNYERNEFR